MQYITSFVNNPRVHLLEDLGNIKSWDTSKIFLKSRQKNLNKNLVNIMNKLKEAIPYKECIDKHDIKILSFARGISKLSTPDIPA